MLHIFVYVVRVGIVMLACVICFSSVVASVSCCSVMCRKCGTYVRLICTLVALYHEQTKRQHKTQQQQRRSTNQNNKTEIRREESEKQRKKVESGKKMWERFVLYFFACVSFSPHCYGCYTLVIFVASCRCFTFFATHLSLTPQSHLQMYSLVLCVSPSLPPHTFSYIPLLIACLNRCTESRVTLCCFNNSSYTGISKKQIKEKPTTCFTVRNDLAY